MSTPVGVVRDPVFFSKVKNVRVCNRTEATAIDRAAKTLGKNRGGPGCLNRISASISGASAGVRLPSGLAAG
jgi:hypothetical protein